MFCSGSEEDSNLEERKIGSATSNAHCEEEDIKLKMCYVLLHDIGPNLISDSKMSHENFMKQRTFVYNTKEEIKSSSKDESQEESIKPDNSSNESMEFKSKDGKKLSKSKFKKKAKSDFSNTFLLRKKKKEINFFSDTDDDNVKTVEKKDCMETEDNKLIIPFFFKEKPAAIDVKQLRKRKQVKYYGSSSSDSEDDSLKKDKTYSVLRSESDDVDSDSDPDCNRKTFKKGAKELPRKVKESQKKFNSCNIDKQTAHKSKYEKMIEEKRIEKLELLKSIGILEAKNDLLEVMSIRKKTKEKSERPAELVRKYEKRRKICIDYTEKSLRKANYDSQCPTSVTFKKALNINNSYEYFVEDFSGVKEENLNRNCIKKEPVLYYKNDLKQLSLDFTARFSEIHLTISSQCMWYPSTENLLLAFSSREFLNLCTFKESDIKCYSFSVHSKPITSLKFNPSVPYHLVSSSRDGTLMLGDMKQLMFNKILGVSTEITNVDFFSPHECLASTKTGEIVIFDVREKNEDQHKRHICHNSVINTVNVHPMMKSGFVTAGKDGKINFWDLRKLTKEPVAQITCHQNEVNSAFFSPVTGRSLLSTSLDGTICIFDISKHTHKGLKSPKRLTFLRGLSENFNWRKIRSLSKEFNSLRRKRAIWLPNSDETFFFDVPVLQIYDKDLNVYATVANDTINVTERFHAFHPFRKMLASFCYSTCYIYT